MPMKRRVERATSAVAAILGGGYVCAALVYAMAGFGSDGHTLPAAMLGLLAGLLLLAAAYGMYFSSAWAWKADIAAHVLAMLAAVLGMLTLTSTTVSVVVLVTLAVSLSVLWRLRPRDGSRDLRDRLAPWY